MLGDTVGAARCYREVLKIEPQHAAAWYDLGELLLANGRRAEAEEALQQASLYSHHPQGWAAPSSWPGSR